MLTQSVATFAQSIPIAYGETRSGSIDLPGEMDAYTFAGQSGDVVIVRIGVVEELSGPFWPGVEVYRPDGALLCSEYAPYLAEVVCSLDTGGIHTIIAWDGWLGTGTGTYDLHVQRANQPGNATPIAFGERRSGSIDGRADMNAYTFNADAAVGPTFRWPVFSHRFPPAAAGLR